jgi:endonuclease YncB( thermonuclease family)
MARILSLTAVGALLLVALLYGVVLNGFGLFGPGYPPGNTTAIAPNKAPKEIAATPVDPVEIAKTPLAPKTDRADRIEQPETAVVEPAPEPEPMRAARDVTPPNVLRRATSTYKDPRLEPAVAEEEEPDPVRRYHRVVVRDARTLEAGDVIIRFAGIAAIAADRTCTDAAGTEWPCGRIAAGALRMLIRHRAIDCAVVSQAEGEITATCSAGLEDINGWLVEQGWAEVSAGTDYAEEADAARAEKRGIYLAEWKPKGQGGSGATSSLTAFTAPTLPQDAFSGTPSVAVPQGPVEGPPDQGAGLVDPVQGNE